MDTTGKSLTEVQRYLATESNGDSEETWWYLSTSKDNQNSVDTTRCFFSTFIEENDPTFSERSVDLFFFYQACVYLKCW